MTTRALLHFRVRRGDGVVLTERVVNDDALDRTDDWLTMLASSDADQALAGLAAGHVVHLEVMDPDGDLSTAGVWQTVYTHHPRELHP